MVAPRQNQERVNVLKIDIRDLGGAGNEFLVAELQQSAVA